LDSAQLSSNGTKTFVNYTPQMAPLREDKEDIVTSITTRRPIRECRLRKSQTESLPPTQRSRKRKRRVTEEVSYPIRSIVAEREGKYGLEYLIDWEDNKKTGEKFGKSWVSDVYGL
jgi:hypothetical protein